MEVFSFPPTFAVFVCIFPTYMFEKRCADWRFGEACNLQCHCSKNSTCNDVTGECDRGCALGWSGRTCQRKNIVYGLPTTIRRTGNMSAGIVSTDGDETTCASSKPNRTGWWKVDLVTIQWVYGMKLTSGNVSFQGWKIHVSVYDNLFWTSPCTVLRYYGTEAYLTCDEPITGRYVGVFNKEGPVTVCEMEVYSCADYSFNRDCDSRCRCSDKTEVCDKVYGTCRSGCQAGWTGVNCNKACDNTYGENCVHRCGHCANTTQCDTTSGRCTHGCAAGWGGDRCHIKCPRQRYGVNCSSTCGHCLQRMGCSSVTGRCNRGCMIGWKGETCDKVCDLGEYGATCRLKCGHCRAETGCDRMTGMCQSGCDQGWEGLFCSQECLAGKYGFDCSDICGHCTVKPCNNINGSCGHIGCRHGWSGETCKTGCTSGNYGLNCKYKCGHCKDSVTCDSMNGTCSAGCLPGYHGYQCIIECLAGTWGGNCSRTCGLCHENKDCNIVTGMCDDGCFVHYHGKYCTLAEQFLDRSSAIVMPVMAVSVAIVGFNLCLLFVCLILKWRRDEDHIPHATIKNKQALLPEDGDNHELADF